VETEVLSPDEAGLSRAARIVKSGGLVAFPTETVYGLGACGLWAEAVAKLFEVKGRPTFDPVILHVASPKEARGLWARVPRLAHKLMKRFWPGPLTLVLPRKPGVPDLVTAGLPTVAVRMPSHPVALDLLRRAGCPIAAPSANRFGRLSPTHHAAVLEQLGGRIDAVIASGPTPVGIESTVVSLVEDPPVVLRPGGTPLEALRELVPNLRVEARVGPSASPGTLPRHYMPSTPLFLLTPGTSEGSEQALDRRRCGLLAFRDRWEGFARVEVLSPQGDLITAAANFFTALRVLDQEGLEAIVAEPVPETGLGVAMMDRLRRAASGKARLDPTRVWIRPRE